MKYDNVIFDLDGVIIDNSEGILHCINYAINKHGLKDISEEAKKSFIGPSLRYSFSKYYDLGDDIIENCVEDYRNEFNRIGYKLFKLYPGVEDTIITLYENGVKCSLCTGKIITNARDILASSGLLKYFDKICGFYVAPKASSKEKLISESIIGKKPLMIGDRIFDIEGAKNNEIKSCFASYGFGSIEELGLIKPDYIIKEIKEIISIVL